MTAAVLREAETQASPPPGAAPIVMQPRQVYELVVQRKATLIDVRNPDERRRARISAAVSIPLPTLDVARLPEGPIVFHCKGGMRSRTVAEKAAAAGRSAGTMEGGIEAWTAQGLPVLGDAKAPLPVMQQTQIAVGGLLLVFLGLGTWVTPWALVLAAALGAGLIVAGVSGTCGLAMVLAKAPWNRTSSATVIDAACPREMGVAPPQLKSKG